MPPSPACFVATIDLALKDKLQNDLIDQGFEIKEAAYAFFSAQKKGISCTLYTSGKLTVQGKGKEEFITFYLEPEILGNVAYSYPETVEVDLTARIGIDEAGKGDFFGPLCVAGVQAGDEKIKELLSIGVRDSKKMSDSAILTMSKQIKERFPHSLLRLFPKKYNELYANFHNLNRLLAWGHATCIAELVEKTGCKNALIDQFAKEPIVKAALNRKNVEVNLTERTHAESDPVVAAASILARAAFLEGLEFLEKSVEMPLPKGASSQVLQAGKKLVDKHGQAILENVAKVHFKTKDQILQSSG